MTQPSTNENYIGYCCSGPAAELEDSPSQVLLVELLGTAILCWAFCSALDKRNLNKHDSLPLKFGIVIIALALPLVSITWKIVNLIKCIREVLVHIQMKVQVSSFKLP